ncbi:phosphoribosyl-ATP pyrophosphatase [Lampropedia cohaerens]|uniref:Phosphoribosyl-ATP pyrophosphatase n=2 Tax=Lampropedia cohaerens TaxID=1610491 RepID=A0A0U1Q291_9BURK|nr:phosphoribosyl-ATP diphosphatase [Lampropedia cohaerens]KKW68860.1 phosphoribosyl-ATP pyrophosphatase [Lampropedia cohaerens]
MSMTSSSDGMGSADALFAHLQQVFESRKPANGGDPASSYVARLLAADKAPDAFLKKIGEEAAEVVMAAKDVQAGRKSTDALVYEVADLWFHTLVALAHVDRSGLDVVTELRRREGIGGLVEKASRPAG